MRYKCVTNEPKYSINPPFFEDFYKKARVIFLKTYYECITCVQFSVLYSTRKSTNTSKLTSRKETVK